MAAGLVKDPAGDQFAFPPGICGNDNVRYILAEELGLDIVILLGGLLDDHQLPFFRKHGEVGHIPFFELFVIFLRVSQGYEMPQGPGHDIFAALDGTRQVLVTVQNPGNVAGYRRLFSQYE